MFENYVYRQSRQETNKIEKYIAVRLKSTNRLCLAIYCDVHDDQATMYSKRGDDIVLSSKWCSKYNWHRYSKSRGYFVYKVMNNYACIKIRPFTCFKSSLSVFEAICRLYRDTRSKIDVFPWSVTVKVSSSVYAEESSHKTEALLSAI